MSFISTARAVADAAARSPRLLSTFVLSLFFVDVCARSLARWHTAHNETFDLAFYVRIAWGFTEGDLYNPIVGASVWGLRLSPVLYPLGWLGRWLGTAPVLLVAQALAVTLAGGLMARIAARRLGARAAWLGALVWVAYPHLGHVLTYEFHPGTIALLPLVGLVDAYDRGAPRALLLNALGVLMCREDFAVILIAFGVMTLFTHRALRWSALGVIGASVIWLGVFTLYLHPRFAPPQGSMVLHFGQWGATAPEALRFILTHPGALFEHLVIPKRLLYAFKLGAPLLMLPALGARWLIPAAPILGMNLLSQFPTTLGLDSHYLTPAVPFILVAALEGAAVARAWLKAGRFVLPTLIAALLIGHLIAGGTPIAQDYPAWAFGADTRTEAARALLAYIPPQATTQVPDRLTPHLAERQHIYRAKSPPQGADYVIVDAHEPQHDAVRATLKEGYRLLDQRGALSLWTRTSL